MKTIAIPFILSLLVLCGCSETQSKPTMSITVPVEELWESNGAFHNVQRIVYEYDDYGNCVEACTYYDDTLFYKDKYAYDDNGNKIKEVIYDYTGFLPSIAYQRKYVYDESDNQTEQIYYEGLSKTSHSYDFYDKNGNLIRSEHINADDQASISEYTYDESGRILTRRHLGYGEETWSTTEYEYLEEGNKATEVCYVDGVLQSTTERVTDDFGRIIDSTTYDETEIRVWHYEYDDIAHTTRITYPTGKTRLETYDENGNTISIEDYDENGELTFRITYQYETIQVWA